MRRWGHLSIAALTVSACAAVEPAGGSTAVFAPSLYATGSEPTQTRIDVDPAAGQQRDRSDLPIAPPLPSPRIEMHPLRPVAQDLAGPIRVCKRGASVDVETGEKAHETNADIWVSGGGDFTVEDWTYSLRGNTPWMKSIGSVRLPDGREARLFEITVREPSSPRFAYVFEGEPGQSWSVRSVTFNGTAADYHPLRRVRFGVAAKAACTR
ncbi:MAG TPA: hypothetical protein VN158_07480 [Caulobacter sp.]|nr:hypothetical protein [Caulobacter sp.]